MCVNVFASRKVHWMNAFTFWPFFHGMEVPRILNVIHACIYSSLRRFFVSFPRKYFSQMQCYLRISINLFPDFRKTPWQFDDWNRPSHLQAGKRRTTWPRGEIVVRTITPPRTMIPWVSPQLINWGPIGEHHPYRLSVAVSASPARIPQVVWLPHRRGVWLSFGCIRPLLMMFRAWWSSWQSFSPRERLMKTPRVRVQVLLSVHKSLGHQRMMKVIIYHPNTFFSFQRRYPKNLLPYYCTFRRYKFNHKSLQNLHFKYQPKS